jgi:nicotinamide mononucleotide transporter
MSFYAFVNLNTPFFEVLSYPVSYVEFFGTLFNLASVALVARKSIWNWPIGIVGASIFVALFYQVNLYAELVQQIYFIFCSFYGWWYWSQSKNKESKESCVATFSSRQEILGWILVTLSLTLAFALLIKNIHILFPFIFSVPASYPFTDSFVTMMSFVAMILMARMRTECWIYWIAVNLVSIGLYFKKGIPFICLLYVVFLLMAFAGLWNWRYIGKSKRT